MEDKAVYILLTRTSTLFSRGIYALTGDQFTHAAIGVDGIDGVFYGFGRKYPRLPFPGAFRAECPWMFRHDVPCRVYRIDMSAESYELIKSVLEQMYREKRYYHYNIAGLIVCRLNMKVPNMRPHHFFCSQFVAWLLQQTGSVELSVSPELFRPSYFCDLACATLVYEGAPIRPVSAISGGVHHQW